MAQTRAKGLGVGGRGIARLVLVMGLLLVAAAAGCTGNSTGLEAGQCAAWGEFWDGASGPNWSGPPGWAPCTREDPCGCGAAYGAVNCIGGSITKM
jgi:hypothetical protein